MLAAVTTNAFSFVAPAVAIATAHRHAPPRAVFDDARYSADVPYQEADYRPEGACTTSSS